MVSRILNWFKSIVKETFAQIFTLLGFSIGWLTMTGSSRDIVGIMIIVSFSIWLLTINFRKD